MGQGFYGDWMNHPKDIIAEVRAIEAIAARPGNRLQKWDRQTIKDAKAQYRKLTGRPFPERKGPVRAMPLRPWEINEQAYEAWLKQHRADAHGSSLWSSAAGGKELHAVGVRAPQGGRYAAFALRFRGGKLVEKRTLQRSDIIGPGQPGYTGGYTTYRSPWSSRDRSRHRRRRDETAPVTAAPAAAPAVAGDRRRKRMPCKVHHGAHNYTIHSCGKQFCPHYWMKCPRCYGTDAGNRVASRDWTGDRAGHRRAARKGWAKKRRVSRAAKTLARSRKGRRR